MNNQIELTLLAAALTFFSTCFGGLFALRFRDRLHFILSFTAGVLLGVVSFELLPEIFRLAQRAGAQCNRRDDRAGCRVPALSQS